MEALAGRPAPSESEAMNTAQKVPESALADSLSLSVVPPANCAVAATCTAEKRDVSKPPDARTSAIAAAVRAAVAAVLAMMSFSSRKGRKCPAAGRRRTSSDKPTGPAAAPRGPEAPCEADMFDSDAAGVTAGPSEPAAVTRDDEARAAQPTCAAASSKAKRAAVLAVVEAVLSAVRFPRPSARGPRSARAGGPRQVGQGSGETSRLRSIGAAVIAAGGVFCCTAGRRRRVRRRPAPCEEPAELTGATEPSLLQVT